MLAQGETFWELFHSAGHWYFELFLGGLELIVLDLIIGFFVWPRIKAHFHRDIKHVGHEHGPDEDHQEDDLGKETALKEEEMDNALKNSRTVFPLPCISCGKELEAVDSISKTNQPYEGTVFHGFGQYGSTVFDPMNGRDYLELNVCDGCLVSKAREGKVLLGQKVQRVVESTPLTPWDPDLEEYED